MAAKQPDEIAELHASPEAHRQEHAEKDGGGNRRLPAAGNITATGIKAWKPRRTTCNGRSNKPRSFNTDKCLEKVRINPIFHQLGRLEGPQSGDADPGACIDAARILYRDAEKVRIDQQENTEARDDIP